MAEHTFPEIALAVTAYPSILKLLEDCEQPHLGDWLAINPGCRVNDFSLASDPAIDRVYLGNEFCDRLIPGHSQIETTIYRICATGLQLSLVTPVVSDDSLLRLRHALDLLPEASEVIVNDWGVLRMLTNEYQHLEPVAGRQICKMIKDPRLPSKQWSDLYKPGFQGDLFQDFLSKFKIRRIELDVPPFADDEFFRPARLLQSAYVRHGYVTRGRVCKIGCATCWAKAKFCART